MGVTLETKDLLKQVEDRRRTVSTRLQDRDRARLGQFFTPAPVADFISTLPTLPEAGTVRILDPGAGVGSLSAALVSRIVADRPNLD